MTLRYRFLFSFHCCSAVATLVRPDAADAELPFPPPPEQPPPQPRVLRPRHAVLHPHLLQLRVLLPARLGVRGAHLSRRCSSASVCSSTSRPRFLISSSRRR